MKKITLFLCSLGLLACNRQPSVTLFSDHDFTAVLNGKNISLYTLESGHGLTLQVTNFGGRVVALWTPDRNGHYEDIVCGHDHIDKYVHYAGERFLGTVVGRYANRIANGRFELGGMTYQLPLNDHGQTLHGGPEGFDMKVWEVDSVSRHAIYFSYISPDGEEGFPGTVTVKMAYELTPDNAFKITYHATTDKPTHINLSHHSFFNLKGAGNGAITDHLLTVHAGFITPVDSVLIPTGALAPVDGTPFDFRQETLIGARINEDNEQLKNGQGYDHNWALDRQTPDEVELAASLYEPHSGRLMEVYTDQPGIQFYSGNFLNGTETGKYGKKYNYREALALETQKYPDTPNHPHFPSTRLNPGETYTQTCVYKFSVK